MGAREKWSLRYVVGPRSIQNTDKCYDDSSRAFTRELTRGSVEVLTVSADERDLANARKTFSSLTVVYPETRRTETGGFARTEFLKRELHFF